MSLQSGDIYRHSKTYVHILLQEPHTEYWAWVVLWLDNGETGKVNIPDLYSGVWRKVA